jgi:hypothetical protein
MPQQKSLRSIEAAIRAEPGGLSLRELQSRFPNLPKRTLQRWVARLVGADVIQAVGRGPACRYLIAQGAQSTTPVQVNTLASASDDDIPLGTEAVELRRQLRLPLARRLPIGYRHEFLDAYQPNHTFYLSTEIRERLHGLGRSPVSERPAGTYARQILDRLLIDLSWSSSRLEGNTYTRLDTQNLIEFGRFAEGKGRLQAQMILNHKAAIEMLVEQADQIGFNRYTLQNLHALLAQNLLAEAAAEGRLRRIDVAITGTVFHPLAIPQQIEEYFDRLLSKAEAIVDPFEQSFFAMVHIPYLQPFEDVNKRVSRLAANIPLIRHNLAPLSFVDVPERVYIDGTLGVYELNRLELLQEVFVWAYERSCRRYTVIRDALPEPDVFRMKYRNALIDVIGSVVANGVHIDDVGALRELARSHVAAADLIDFMAMLSSELRYLHEGNIARYRLRPSAFRTWQQAQN